MLEKKFRCLALLLVAALFFPSLAAAAPLEEGVPLEISSPSVMLALKLAKICQVKVEDIFEYEEDES